MCAALTQFLPKETRSLMLEVRMASIFEKRISLGDISDPHVMEDWPVLLLAILVIDLIVIFLVRYYPDVFGKQVNVWYDNFGLPAVIADVGIIAIGFWITRYIYNSFVAPTYGFSPLYFLLLLLGVQLIHDILFYFAVLKPMPEGHNEMIDVMFEYSKENGWKILLADAGMMLGAGGLAMLLKEQSAELQFGVGLFSIYSLAYILFTRNKWSP